MVLLANVCATAQAPTNNAPTAAAPPVANASLAGSVVDAKGGQPLKKARITLRRVFEPGPQGPGVNPQMQMELARRNEERASPYNATTDTTGKFTVPAVRPGRYRLYVERSGYVRTEYGQRQPGRPGAVMTLEIGRAHV